MKNNKFDWLLIVMMALLVFGNVGNGAQPVRLFIVALAPFMIIDAFKKAHVSLKYYRYECFFLAGWWLWAVAFFFMAQNESESLKHIIYLIIHFFGFLEVLWASSKANNPQRSIKYGWVLMLLCSLPIAINEFLTDTHLATSLWDSDSSLSIGGVKVKRPFAAVTFGNPNTYNTILCWILPSVFFCILYPDQKWETPLGVILMFFAIFIIIANSSRGAILCVSVMMLLFIYCYYKKTRSKIFLISIILAIVIVFGYYLFDLLFMIFARFSDQGMSDDGRTENIMKGIQALMSRGGLGIGIGNYEPVMNNEYRVLYAAPHNLYLEVLVVYGIPVFCGFVGMLVRAFIRGWRGTTLNRNMLLFCFTTLLLASFIDSEHILKVPTWMFLATTYVYLDEKYNKSSKTESNVHLC